MTIRIGTRGSKLALWQANFVAKQLNDQGVATEIVTISTQGDRVQDRFLHEMGGKGVFIRELETALQENKIDCAVHSLKDLPAELPEGFQLEACLERHQPTDTLIMKSKRLGSHAVTPNSLNAMGPLTIATGSLRRMHLLKEACPEVTTVPIRGNVDTRLRKLEESQEWDGIILATASLERLSLTLEHAQSLNQDWFVPSSCQGIIAIETRANETHTEIRNLNHAPTELAARVERGVLAALGGDCTLPVGVHYTEEKCQAFLFRNEQYYRTTIPSSPEISLMIDHVMKSLRLDPA